MYDNHAVCVNDVEKSYGSQKILQKISFTVEKGSIYGLLGSSGCGKTTIVTSIVGRTKIDAGEIWILGEKGGGVPGRKVGYMPQWSESWIRFDNNTTIIQEYNNISVTCKKAASMQQLHDGLATLLCVAMATDYALGRGLYKYFSREEEFYNNTALVDEFTVKDAIYYFGRIFEMSERLIAQRYHKLQELLDLPPSDRYIKNCSGGEKRRVSFAAALIHKPELLILDEPSVGADPLIRDRIWSHFIEITTKEKTTVFITTHYIEEARQAGKVGFLRHGKLVVEEKPNSLITRFNAETLEDVFLILSKRQEDDKLDNPNSKIVGSEQTSRTRGGTPSNINLIETMDMDLTKTATNKKVRENNKMHIFSVKRVRALLDKNYKQFYRNSLAATFLLLTPLTQMILFLMAVGGNIKNIPLAIVNDEKVSYPCTTTLFNTSDVAIHQQYCYLGNVSCRFLSYLEDSMIQKIDYKTVSHAIEDVKLGKIVGVLHIYENITETIEKMINNEFDTDKKPFVSEAWMDMSEYPIGSTIKDKIKESYSKFQESLYVDCGYPADVSNSPVHIQESLYGSKNDPFIIFMTPGIVLTLIFFFGIMMTSSVVISEKCEGIWDRSIVAGVTSLELTLSHFVLQALLLIVMVVETMVVIFAIFRQAYVGSIWNIFLIIYLQGVCGLVCGFWVSAVSTNHVMAHIIISGFFNTAAVCCGFIWPVEAMPTALRIFSKCLPFTIPIESLRNVIQKGWSLDNLQILGGIGIMTAWALVLGVLCVYVVKTKR